MRRTAGPKPMFRQREPSGGLQDPRGLCKEDGSGAHLVSPPDTRALLQQAGFTEIAIEDTGEKYLAAYKKVLALWEEGALPPLGIQILLGANAREKTRNAARNIEEGRTHPIQVICRKRT